MLMPLTALALGFVAPPPITPVATRLDNGVQLIAIAVPDTETIAIEAFCSMGMADDPEGQPQAAHLLEHIVCHGATGDLAAEEAWTTLSQIGMVNAETMGSATHYELVVPSDRLGWALDLTAQRLASLRIDEAIIEQEMPRCASEVELIETHRPAAIGKFAFMAANQVLRFHAHEVTLKSRPEQLTAGSLARLHESRLGPAGLTLVVAGDFEPDELVRQARATVGRLDPKPAPPITPINLLDQPPTIEATWDVGIDAVIVAVQPPDDPYDRTVLTAWSLVAQMGLATSPAISKLAQSPLAGGWSFPVGDMPMMVVAIPKEGVTPRELAGAMRAELLGLASPDRRAGQASMVQAMSANTLSPPRVTARQLKRMVAQLSRGSDDPQTRKRAQGMALLQTALTQGLAHQVTANLPAGSAQRLRSLDDQTLNRILARTVTPERVRVLILHQAPPAQASPKRASLRDRHHSP